MNLAIVILAAGKSIRFKSATPKVLYPLGGKPMLQYTLDLAAALTDAPPVIVVGPETADPIRAWTGDRAQYVLQRERLGTGHAVLQTHALLAGHADQILVLYGDMPLLQETTLRRLIARREETAATLALLTLERDDPRGFGRIVRDTAGRIQAIVEDLEATPEIAAIRELNPGIYTFAADFLWEYLPRVQPSPRKGEYYLTDLIALAAQAGYRITSSPMPDPTEGLGINTRVDLSLAATALRRRINEHWMLAGVTFIDPAGTYIDATVTLGRDTILHPNTYLRGQTTIGTASEIGPHTIIEDSTVGNHCRVLASVLEHAVMEDESDIGPFGHLRQGSRVCTGAHMGNFGEMKNSTLGPGAKMGHFSYLGDATIGDNANIGAGTITCNYDGRRKHPTIVEEGAFIGSDTMLVAPVRIGAGAKTGAGSVVTHDVPPHTLAYGVPARTRRTPPPAQETPSAPADPEPDQPT